MLAAARPGPLRRSLVLLLALLVAVSTHVVVAEAALPGHLGAGEFTTFEIDGDVAGVDDWAGGGYGPGTTPQGRPTTGIVGLTEAVDACQVGTEDGWAGSLAGQPLPWSVQTENMPDKTDICEFGAAYEIVDVDGAYHFVLYGYAARSATATGDQSLFFLLDRPDGQVGDIILEYDFDPSGSSTVVEHRWSGSAWVASTLSAGVQNAVGANPFEAGANAETFVEFAIDLTANDIFPPIVGGVEQCVTFTAAGFATNNSNSLNSQLKDRASFGDGGTGVSNCSDVEISKQTNIASDATFLYGLRQADGGTVHDGTLVPPAGVTDLDNSNVGIAAQIRGDQTHLWQNVIAGPDYELLETVPDGWDLVDITCTWWDPFTGQEVTDVVTEDAGEGSAPLRTFQIPPPTVDNGVTTSCVITNETSGLIVEKAGGGDPAQVFEIAVSGAPGSPYSLAVDESTGVLTYGPGTVVTIDETVPTTTPAWTYLGTVCRAEDGTNVGDFGPGDPVEVTTIGGQVITCVVSNRQAGEITITKDGAPAGGGPFGFTGDLGEFELGIGQSTTFEDLDPGEYTVEELIDAANVEADPDYVLADISCAISQAGAGTSGFTYGGDATFEQGDTDATIALAAGDVVDCTFTNEQAGRLVVVKETDGADDTFTFTGAIFGGLPEADRQITTTGGTTAPGDEIVLDLPAGGYDGVAELIPPGWDLVDAACSTGTGSFVPGEDAGGVVGITINAGETVTCTFTNERETATLTLTKAWGPSAATGDAVDLTATGDDAQIVGPAVGDSTVGGETNDAVLSVFPGEEVTLEEVFGDNAAAYDSLLACDPAVAGTLDYTDGDTQGTFTVVADDPVDVTCTFTNERQNAELTLVKEWVDGADGDVSALEAFGDSGNEPLAEGSSTVGGADAPAVLTIWSGETVTLFEQLLESNEGTYDTTFECTDAANVTYTLGALTAEYAVPAVPVDVTCTFTNTRTSTTLTLDKQWVDAADGDGVDLAIDGEAGLGTGESAGDGSVIAPAALTVFSGETVTLSETFAPGNPDWYATDLTCGAGDLTHTDDALTGQLEITSTPAEGITCTFVNTRETAQVVVAKDLSPDTDDGVFDLSVDGEVVVVDGGDGAASAPVEVLVGDPVAIAEAGGTLTNLANYDATLTCDGGVVPDPDSGTAGEIVVGTPDTTVTCTFTNARRSAQLTLTKDWVNGATGDEVSLAAVGSSGNSPNATGGSIAPDTDTDAVLTIWAGEDVGLAEDYGDANAGSYTASLSCSEDGLEEYVEGDLSATFVVPADPVDVTCTFVNTRTSATLTLQKQWVDGAAGDTADLDVTATLGQDPADGATSTADGTVGSFVDPVNVVTAEVLSGETVTLDEVLDAGSTGAYDSELSCDAGGLDPAPTAGTSGSYTVPFEPVDVTCTFTNTRARVDLVLEKAWVDAVADDTATLSFAGAVDAPSSDSTATGAAGLEVDAPVVSGDVLSGETVTITETLADGNAGSYASSLACDGGEPIGQTSGELTVPSDATEAITCRFTNEAGRGTIVIVKNVEGADGTFGFTGDWPDPTGGDTTPVGGFEITSDGGSGSATWTGVLVPADGSPYTVTELDPTPAYDGTDLVCADPDGGSSVDGLTGTIDLDPGETVTCTYTNTQRSTITVVKDAVPDDDQSFGFTTTGAGLPTAFALVDDGSGTADTFTSDLLPAGATYGVTETPVAGWDLTSATCDNGDGPDAITPAPGTNVTCTFVNEADPGRVTVTKTVAGVADDLAWSFDVTIDPVEVGVTSPQTVSGVGEGSDVVTFEPLTLNRTYTIDEPVLPPGWDQTSVSCAGVPDEDPSAPGQQVTITEPDQTIGCAITNTAQPGALTITKSTVGGDGSFTFTLTPAGGEPTEVDVTTTDGTGQVTVDDLLPGETITISEVDPGQSWIAGELTCTVVGADGSQGEVAPVAGFTVEPGDEVTCAVTNTATATVVVDKVTDPVGDETPFDFQFGPLGGDAIGFTLTDTDAPEVLGGLPAGDYLLQELVPDGWTLTDVTCAPEQFVDDAGAATITLAPGDVVTCTYTNSGRGDLTIAKTLVDVVELDGGAFSATYDLVVTGDAAVAEPYTVTDTLRFGAGIVVDAATVSSTDATVNPGWDGIDDVEVTDGQQVLPPGGTHVYTVEVAGTVAASSSEADRDCVLATGEAGTGLLNEATVTYEGGTDTDDACGAALPPPDVGGEVVDPPSPGDREPPTQVVPTAPAVPGLPLARTGVALGLLVALAVVLLGTGLVLRRGGRRSSRRAAG